MPSATIDPSFSPSRGDVLSLDDVLSLRPESCTAANPYSGSAHPLVSSNTQNAAAPIADATDAALRAEGRGNDRAISILRTDDCPRQVRASRTRSRANVTVTAW